MKSKCGRFIIIFNGEIYNFREIREQLEKLNYKFLGTSDTEVFLACIAEFGIDKRASFPMGCSPLRSGIINIKQSPWGETGLDESHCISATLGGLYFASELKALLSLPSLKFKPNSHALKNYLQFGYVPAPLSIFEEISKLHPGTIICFTPGNGKTSQRTYWDAINGIRKAKANQFKGSFNEAKTQLTSLLSSSVKNCMISDVPLGSFLSGGIDSTLVTALMTAEGKEAINTFSIGYDSQEYDESNFALETSRILGSEHLYLTATGQHALKTIPSLIDQLDEPLADPSSIPTYLVSNLARTQVTVALTGDAGDELFGGYSRHLYASHIQNILSVPRPLRKSLLEVLRLVPFILVKNIRTFISSNFTSRR